MLLEWVDEYGSRHFVAKEVVDSRLVHLERSLGAVVSWALREFAAKAFRSNVSRL